jgi:hypothetical protein
MNKQDIIKELLELWGRCIGCSHHKQRDFEFSINTQYTVYQDVKYVVEHHGYVMHELESYSTFNTYEEAENYLIQLLIYGILRETENSLAYEESEGNWCDLSKERATEIKSQLMDLIAREQLIKQLDNARLMS